MSAAPVRVRQASPADWGAVGALVAESLDLSDDTPERAADPSVRLLVAVADDGTVLGTATATRPATGWDRPASGPGEAGIARLAVAAGVRGQGVGRLLAQACVDDARQQRAERVAVAVPGDAVAAERLCERLGFRRLPWRDVEATDGSRLHAYARDLAPVEVREPTDDELAATGELTARAYVGDDLVDAASDYVGSLRDAAARRNGATLLVAVDDRGRVVGTVTSCRPGSPYAELSAPGEAEFRMLAVDPAARGWGVGEALVHACIDRAGAAGDHTLVLSTQPVMLAARRLYERLGFRPDPARDWSPGPGIELHAFSRPVTSRTVDPRSG